MWMEYPELHEELKQVKAMMHASITIENQQIREAIWAVLESGGKMVRPAYLIFILNVERIETGRSSCCGCGS